MNMERPGIGREEFAKNLEDKASAVDLSTEEDIRRQAEETLSNFGLQIEDLRDKQVLDLGSGPSVLQRAAQHAGIHSVLSADLFSEALSKKSGLNQIATDARNMGIKSESMDLILSVGGPLNTFKKEESEESALKECFRVLKDNGEIRLGPVLRCIEKELTNREAVLKIYATKKSGLELTGDEYNVLHHYNEKLRNASLDYLKNKGYHATLETCDLPFTSRYPNPWYGVDENGKLIGYYLKVIKNKENI